MGDKIRLDDLPFTVSELSIGNKEIASIYFESPGVYRLCMTSTCVFLPPQDLLVVTADAPAISTQARSYGEVPYERPDLTVFRCDKMRGGREIVEFEICRYLTKEGIKLPEEYSLRSMAYSAMEMYPEYFGALPAPMQTPWGSMVRYFELARGIFWLETDRCKKLLAVASFIWEVDLSESAKALGKMVGRDAAGYLFFSKRASSVPLFELLPLHREWETSRIIDKAALMNALSTYHIDYTAEHNEREQKIVDIVHSNGKGLLGISLAKKLESSDIISPSAEAGTNYCLFLEEWGRDGAGPALALDLSILTEKQRTAYLIRKQGLTYKQIAEKMGGTANTAAQHVRNAERKLRESQRYQRIRQQNRMPMTFPLSREDLLLIEAGLDLLEDMRKGIVSCADSGWESRLPYQPQLAEALHKRVKAALYK